MFRVTIFAFAASAVTNDYANIMFKLPNSQKYWLTLKIGGLAWKINDGQQP